MEQRPLPFDAASLDGISEKTVAVHHDKLYAGYVAKLKEVWERLAALRNSGKAVGNATYSELRALKDAETFAANGVYLHEWYFDMLGGEGDPSEAPELSAALTAKWGNADAFVAYMTECAMAARGWTILAWNPKEGELNQFNADAHNQGGVWGCLPIIVLDVYEHAYFMDYGSDKKAYIEAFWKNFNWAKAEEFYLKARQISY